MKEEKEPPSKFKVWAATRIAEFPTLYHCPEDVISDCILSNRGDCTWKDGVIALGDQHYDKASKKWGPYPLTMPLETALGFHQYKLPDIPWDFGSARAPISNIPNDADKSFLDAIDMFLFRWEKLKEEDWKTLATAYCLIMYGRASNEHAGEPDRKLTDYLRFMKAIPEYRARIRAVEYFQTYKAPHPDTYIGMHI